MPAVIIDNVHKSFGTNQVLKSVSLTVETGQVVAIIGRSGSGKSTLLRCVNGLEVTQSGRIEVAGHVMDHDAKKRANCARMSGLFSRATIFSRISPWPKTSSSRPSSPKV